jgi:hypothetical protein
LQRCGCSAQAFHHRGCHERNGEIEKHCEKGGKGHDEREVKPVLNYDHVLRCLNEAACGDRQEKHVADKLNRDVHQADGHMPE